MIRPLALRFVLVMGVTLSGDSLACRCAEPIDPDHFVDRSDSIIIVIPNRAEVVAIAGASHDRILANVDLLDVLKGPHPDVLPVMISHVSDSNYRTSCDVSMSLGMAYVLFLEKINQPSIYISACMPHRLFESLLIQHERFCADLSQEKDRCSRKLLKMLRTADATNEKYPTLLEYR